MYAQKIVVLMEKLGNAAGLWAGGVMSVALALALYRMPGALQLGGLHLAQLQVTFPISPLTWLPIAFLAVVAVMGVAAIVYQLSAILDSPNARAWSRLQIYEGLYSILLIIIFVTFTYLFTVNPEGSFAAAGLVAPKGSPYTCYGAQDVFQLGTCSLEQFNRFAFGVFQGLYYVAFFMGSTPGFSLGVNMTVQDVDFVVSTRVTSLFPVGMEDALDSVFAAVVTLVTLNQVQLILLSGSLLWLSFFMVLGLVARTFGFARSFGGAMIAFGLGLGLVYPLLTSITYGYVDTQLSSATGGCGSTGCTVAGFTTDLIGALFGVILGQGLPDSGWVFQLAVVGAGLTFIPFINFTILDSFIVDFSQAVGERMDFMSMLAGLV